MATTTNPTITIRLIPAELTYPLRHAVLWPDRPLGYVQLPEDIITGQHFGAFVRGDEEYLVSVISLFSDGDTARFRKFATHAAWQSKGIGSALLRHTIDAARSSGAKAIWCDARSSALPFYGRFGMEAEGDVFYKGEIPYLLMRRTL